MVAMHEAHTPNPCVATHHMRPLYPFSASIKWPLLNTQTSSKVIDLDQEPALECRELLVVLVVVIVVVVVVVVHFMIRM